MTERTDTFPPTLIRWQWLALLVGAALLVLCIVLACFPSSRLQFFNAYLFAWMFVLGLSLGSVALVMLHNLTGGEWGLLVRRPAESASLVLPLLAIGFIPILIGVRFLFPWANTNLVAGDRILQHQAPYMNVPMFTLRAIVYFVIWIALAWILARASLRYDHDFDPGFARNIRRLSAGGIVVYIITISLASVDWIMSREMHWYSSVLGFILAVAETLTAMVFLIALLWMLRRQRPFAELITPHRLNDLGNLFLTLIILWAYMSFAQLLVIWMGNTVQDSKWYVRRGLGLEANPWRWVGLILVVLHFFVPFLILLSRDAKQRLGILCTLSAAVLVLRVIDVYWLVKPSSLQPMRLNLTLMDFLLPVALSGIWFAAFVALLRRRPLMIRAHDAASSAVNLIDEERSGEGGVHATGNG